MKLQRPSSSVAFAVALLAALGIAAFLVFDARGAGESATQSQPKRALTVSTVSPETTTMPVTIEANGNIAAWQEASIGTEVNGLRLGRVLVNVGDVVRRGQVLATFVPDTIEADLKQTRAAVAEAEAHLAEAHANAQRARELSETGALSAQQIQQYVTAEHTAQARLDAQRAAAEVQQLRLRQTKVVAPDNGVISARSATVGAVLPAGTEMFRLIRGGRLEWRAQVPAEDLSRIEPGMPVQVTTPSGAVVDAKVRMIGPTVDEKTRNGIVYVDLAQGGDARAGMFASGRFELGTVQRATLPQGAVLLRDGFHYVMRVGPDDKVVETKVQVGPRMGDRIAILGGLPASARVVANGGGFLADGDLVKVVTAPPHASPGNGSSVAGADGAAPSR